MHILRLILFCELKMFQSIPETVTTTDCLLCYCIFRLRTFFEKIKNRKVLCSFLLYFFLILKVQKVIFFLKNKIPKNAQNRFIYFHIFTVCSTTTIFFIDLPLDASWQ
jgi:hypothetical protein